MCVSCLLLCVLSALHLCSIYRSQKRVLESLELLNYYATVNNRVWMYFWHSDSILFFWGMLWNSVYLDTTSIAVLKSWQLFFN